MERPGRRSTPSRLIAGALLIFIAAVVVHLTQTPTELEKFRVELRSKGFKLTGQELAAARNQPPMDLAGFTSADRELEKLPRPRLALMEAISPNSGSPVPLASSDEILWKDDGNLTNRNWDDLAKILKQAEPALQQIRTLAHQNLPEHGLGWKTPAIMFINLSLWLSADSISALRQGFRTAVLEDLEALTDLALLGCREKALIAKIGCNAITLIGIKTAWEMLQSAEWTQGELERMQAAWEKVLPLEGIPPALEGELALVDEAEGYLPKAIATYSGWERVTAMFSHLDRSEDTLFRLKYSFTYFEAARALQNGEKWISVKTRLNALESSAWSKRSSRYRHAQLRLGLPKVNEIFETAVRAEAARQLLLADIAVRKFKLRHQGAVPATLNELAPEFLSPAAGRDPFSGGFLAYRANPDGTYLLYSVGMNGVDDGGYTSLGGMGGANRSFWMSADMVWPFCR